MTLDISSLHLKAAVNISITKQHYSPRKHKAPFPSVQQIQGPKNKYALDNAHTDCPGLSDSASAVHFGPTLLEGPQPAPKVGSAQNGNGAHIPAQKVSQTPRKKMTDLVVT